MNDTKKLLYILLRDKDKHDLEEYKRTFYFRTAISTTPENIARYDEFLELVHQMDKQTYDMWKKAFAVMPIDFLKKKNQLIIKYIKENNVESVLLLNEIYIKYNQLVNNSIPYNPGSEKITSKEHIDKLETFLKELESDPNNIAVKNIKIAMFEKFGDELSLNHSNDKDMLEYFNSLLESVNNRLLDITREKVNYCKTMSNKVTGMRSYINENYKGGTRRYRSH